MTGDNYVATVTLGGAGAHATYYHKANDQVHNTSNSVCGCICAVLVQNPHTSLKDHFIQLYVSYYYTCMSIKPEKLGVNPSPL